MCHPHPQAGKPKIVWSYSYSLLRTTQGTTPGLCLYQITPSVGRNASRACRIHIAARAATSNRTGTKWKLGTLPALRGQLPLHGEPGHVQTAQRSKGPEPDAVGECGSPEGSRVIHVLQLLWNLPSASKSSEELRQIGAANVGDACGNGTEVRDARGHKYCADKYSLLTGSHLCTPLQIRKG